MKSGPLEGPGEAHGGVLLNDVGIGLFAFGTFPCLHGCVGSRIHTLNPRQTSEEGKVGWMAGTERGEGAIPRAVTVRPVLNCEVPDGHSGPFLCEITTSRGISYVDCCTSGAEGATLPIVPGGPTVGRERKTYHHEVELAIHRADGLKHKCDPGHLFILCVCRH